MDFLIGVIAIAIGLLFCLKGFVTARILMTMWGGFVGFLFGAGLMATMSSGDLLSTVVGWLVGFAFAFIFGWLAYTYWAIAVVLAIGSLGFILATALMGALGMNWDWFVVLVGVVVGVALAYFSARASVPASLLMVITSFAGAGAVVFGLLLVFGRISLDRISTTTTNDATDGQIWWIAIYLAVAIAGIFAQGAFTARGKRAAREAWGLSS